jgi:hypothetical protein
MFGGALLTGTTRTTRSKSGGLATNPGCTCMLNTVYKVSKHRLPPSSIQSFSRTSCAPPAAALPLLITAVVACFLSGPGSTRTRPRRVLSPSAPTRGAPPLRRRVLACLCARCAVAVRRLSSAHPGPRAHARTQRPAPLPPRLFCAAALVPARAPPPCRRHSWLSPNFICKLSPPNLFYALLAPPFSLPDLVRVLILRHAAAARSMSILSVAPLRRGVSCLT